MTRRRRLIVAAALLTGCNTEPTAGQPTSDTTDPPTAAILIPYDPRPAVCADDELAGTWNVEIDGLSNSTWQIRNTAERRFDTVETGLGNSTGTIRHTSHLNGVRVPGALLTGDWMTTDSAGTLTWIVDETCQRATGTVTFTTHHDQPADDIYPTTLTRSND